MKFKFFLLGTLAATIFIGLIFFVLVKWSAKTTEEDIRRDMEISNSIFAEITLIENFDLNKFIPVSNEKVSFENDVVIINFWATWCKPCIIEMEDFENLYREKRLDFDFIFASNEDFEKIKNFKIKNEDKFNLPFYYYNNETLMEGIEKNFLPTTYIFNKKSKVAFKISGVNKWNSDLFKQLIRTLSYD